MTASDHPEDTFLSRVEVSLSAIRRNFRTLRQHVPPGVKMLCVIKADAYGHGAVPVARVLEEEKADMLCVARIEEALELDKAGIKLPILIFAPPVSTAQAALFAEKRFRTVVCDPVHIKLLAVAGDAAGKPMAVHLKIDVGMSRMGCEPGQALSLAARIAENPDLVLEGLMAHLPCADVKPEARTADMIRRFRKTQSEIFDAGFTPKYVHVANTAGMLDFDSSYYSAVRTGIALYGQYPNNFMERRLPLTPAMTLKSTVIFVKQVPAETPVSYCHTYQTKRASVLATVALGYADGFPRHASGLSEMIVHGVRAPQVGRICMDQLVLDVTDIPNVKIGDEVIAFGIGQGSAISPEEVAERAGSIGYELTSRIGKRLPVFYSS